MHVDMQKVQREMARWFILLTLDKARPCGAGEPTVLYVLQQVHSETSRLEMRKELQYLHDRGLIELTKSPAAQWWAKLTRYGVDVVEYTVDCEPGIARPEKYW
jgi:hypothetical protein